MVLKFLSEHFIPRSLILDTISHIALPVAILDQSAVCVLRLILQQPIPIINCLICNHFRYFNRLGHY